MAQERNPYYVDPGNDYSAGLSGLSNTLLNVRQQQMQNAELQRRQEKEDRANQRFQEVQAAAMKAFESQDPDVVARTSIQYPEITEMFKQTLGLKTELQNREAQGFLREFATASPENRPALYERRIQSIIDRGGDPSHTIQSYEDFKARPDDETRDVINTWAAIGGNDYKAYSDEQKAAQRAALEQQKLDQQQSLFNQAEAGRNQRAYARAAQTAGASTAQKQTAHMQDFAQYQELKKNDPEGAKAFGQAAGFVSKEGRELAPGVQTRLAKTIDSAVSAENNVGKFSSLANDIEQSNISGGYLGGKFSETLKELTGSQDAITDLRREVNSVKASQATANLPPGSASDADVKLAMGPFPTDNANKKQLASWLRGLSKLQQINADFHNFKADYISDNGSERGMLQAWKQRGAGVGSGGGASPAKPPVNPPAAGGWEIIP